MQTKIPQAAGTAVTKNAERLSIASYENLLWPNATQRIQPRTAILQNTIVYIIWNVSTILGILL